MRRRLLILVGGALAVGTASCQCGNTASFSCRRDTDCPTNHICVNGECLTGVRTNDGGFVLTDGGTSGGQDSGTGGGQDSGMVNPGDGGGCVNLACNIQQCPGNDAGTTLTGTVYDPSGQLPLYNAYVYVPNGTPDAFTDGVSCEACSASLTGFPLSIALTDYLGHFTLTNVPSGTNIPLVIQIGRWRRQVVVPTVTACQPTAVAATLTHMPTNHTQGDIPKMAIDTGGADPFECLLSKMGLAGEMKNAGQGGRIDYYVENGTPIDTNTPAGTQLYSTLPKLESYDIVILPCEGGPNAKAAPAPQNLVDYTNDGGRVFTTHYGYEWLGTGYGYTPFPNTADWSPEGMFTTPDPITVTINQGFPKGQAFYQWLGGPQVNALSGGLFSISQPRYDVGKVTATAPAYVNPTSAWMFGNPTANWVNGSSQYTWTPHMTFNTPYEPPPLPDGDAGIECGRVVYSDFHVNTDATTGQPDFPASCASSPYTAQEKALVFMLFDLSSCVQDNGKPPPVCVPLNGTCTAQSQCCNGLSCLNATGGACGAGGGGEAGCTCYSPIG